MNLRRLRRFLIGHRINPHFQSFERIEHNAIQLLGMNLEFLQKKQQIIDIYHKSKNPRELLAFIDDRERHIIEGLVTSLREAKKDGGQIVAVIKKKIPHIAPTVISHLRALGRIYKILLEIWECCLHQHKHLATPRGERLEKVEAKFDKDTVLDDLWQKELAYFDQINIALNDNVHVEEALLNVIEKIKGLAGYIPKIEIPQPNLAPIRQSAFITRSVLASAMLVFLAIGAGCSKEPELVRSDIMHLDIPKIEQRANQEIKKGDFDKGIDILFDARKEAREHDMDKEAQRLTSIIVEDDYQYLKSGVASLRTNLERLQELKYQYDRSDKQARRNIEKEYVSLKKRIKKKIEKLKEILKRNRRWRWFPPGWTYSDDFGSLETSLGNNIGWLGNIEGSSK